MSTLSKLPVEDTPAVRKFPFRSPRHVLWKSILRWTVAVLGILVILITIAIPVLLHNARVHQYVLRTARQQASTALGTQVDIRDFNLAFSGISPTLDVYDVRVHGRAPFEEIPVLELGHARVGVMIVSLLRRSWYLNDLELHRPVVRVVVDTQGNSNLPQPPKKNNGKSQSNIFDLGVRHALLNGGELYYNNQKSAMDADVHDLQLRASYDDATRVYSGDVGYSNGHLKLERFNPIPHDFSATFRLSEQRFTLESAALRSGRSLVDLAATVDNYATPNLSVNGRYRASVDATEVRRILKNASLPLGTVDLNGTIQYQAKPNAPMLNAVVLNGRIDSRRLEVRTPSVNTSVESLSATYSFSGGNAELRDLRAQLFGGSLMANATVRDVMGASQSRLTAKLSGAQLAALQATTTNASLKQVGLTGSIDTSAEVTWGKNLSNLSVMADSTINGGVIPPNAPNARVPINGVVHARYNGRTREVELANSYLRLQETSVNLNGTVSRASALRVDVSAQDLHELETLAELFGAPAKGASAQPLGLYGNATMTAMVRGSTADPQINGHLVASNLRVKGSEWRSLKTDFAASSSLAVLQNAELVPAKQGRIGFDVRTGLNRWKYAPTSPIEVRLNVNSLNVGDLARLAGMQTPVTGTLNATADLHGSQNNPIGSANIALVKAVVAGENIDSIQLHAHGDGSRLNTTTDLRLPAGTVNANITLMPKTRGYSADVRTNGIRLEQLQTIKARGLQIAGVLNLNASGSGTFDNPALRAEAHIPQLRMKGQTVSNIALQTTVANHIAQFALNSDVLQNTITAGGKVNLTGDYPADVAIDTRRIELQPLVAVFLPDQAPNFAGETELHATLLGPLKRKEQVEAHVLIPTLALNYKNSVQIGAAQPIRLNLVNGVLNLERTALRGTGTDLQLQASVPVTGNQPMSLLALGTIDLSLAHLVSPGTTSSGQLRFDINSFGSTADPNIQGRINIVDASVTLPNSPVGLENANGVLTLTKDRLNVTSFKGTVGGGSVTAGGGIALRPAIRFDMALRGEGVRVLVPPGIRAGVDADLGITGSLQAAVLRGSLDLAQLSFTPDFDVDSLMGSFGGTIAAPPAQGFTNNLQLDLAVNSSNGINLVTRDVSVQGNANLRVRGTAAEPVVLGRIIVNGGDLIFRANRYVFQAGTIDFVNPMRTQPNVNLSFSTTIQQYDIAIRLQGPVEKMRTSYTSDPALPPSDIINLIAFGKTSEAAAANPSPTGALGAQSALASAVSGQVASNVARFAGLSQLSIDPTLGNTGQQPGANISVQQRVTGKLFVTFSADVTGTQRDVIQLEYQPNRRTRISTTRDQNGGFAFDTRFQKSW